MLEKLDPADGKAYLDSLRQAPFQPGRNSGDLAVNSDSYQVIAFAAQGGENGGNLTPGRDTPSGPVPGYGSSSKDELNTDYVRPSYAGKGDEKFDDSTSDRLEKSGNYEVSISKASSANQASGEALYRGQQQVDAAANFQSIEAYV